MWGSWSWLPTVVVTVSDIFSINPSFVIVSLLPAAAGYKSSSQTHSQKPRATETSHATKSEEDDVRGHARKIINNSNRGMVR